MTQLKLYLLGAPRVEVDDEPVVLPRRKVVALLVYLALSPGALQRKALATMLWPESSSQSARASLRRELHALSSAIGSQWLESTRDEVKLVDRGKIWIDVSEFRAALAQGETGDTNALRNAVSLYSDDFLTGFTLSDAPTFDDWQFFESESLRREYGDALARLVYLLNEAGQYDPAIEHARHWLALDPLEESVHRELMQLYALAGQAAAAVRQYDECMRILDEELGVPPAPETEALYEAIRTRRLGPAETRPPVVSTPPHTSPSRPTPTQPPPLDSRLPSEVTKEPASEPLSFQPAAATPIEQQHNLPSLSGPIVGRQEEREAILDLLLKQEACRLLTLVGPGGIGKTTLALQVVHELVEEWPTSRASERFAHGIYFVPLENASDGEEAIAQVADAVGFIFQGSADPMAQMLNHLRGQRLLLLLDNMEHLLDQADLIANVLQQAPGITILATSREALALQEEWLYGVSGFALPDPISEAEEPEEAPAENLVETLPAPLAENHAVQLFVQRARRADSSLKLLGNSTHEIVRICHLVDGLPLGLELAATWVRTLSLAEIGDEIERDLDFLATTRRGVSPRHTSLRGVLEQTWRLLTPAEQEAFCRLSLFGGGFTRQAASRVADASMMMLAALVRKSIISSNTGGRYTMHGLLRQFATEKLTADPAAAPAAAEKHSRYYGALLQTLQGELLGSSQTGALAQIGDDLENIRNGWQWALAHAGESAVNLRLVGDYVEPLYQFYDTRSRFRAGHTMFQQALQALEPLGDGPDTRLVRSRVRSRLGWFAFQIGLTAQARINLERGVDTLRQIDAPANAPEELIFTLNYLGAVYRHGGEYEEAKEVLQESQALCRASGDQYGLTVALNILGQIAYEQGELEEAEAYCQESLTTKERIGDRRGRIFSLLYLGLVARAKGENAAAVRLFRESMLISQEHGDRRGLAIAQSLLADVELAMDHVAEARTLYAESLSIYNEIYNLRGIVTAHLKLGDVARSLKNAVEARQQYEAALDRARELQLSPQEREALLGEALAWLASEMDA